MRDIWIPCRHPGRENRLYLVTSQFAEVDLHPDVISNEHMRFRLHDHQCRFLLEGGTAEDVTTIGGQLDDHDAFDETIRRVTTAGVPVTEGTDEGTALRRVERLLRSQAPRA